MADYTCNVFFCKRIIFTARKEWGRLLRGGAGGVERESVLKVAM